jgi:hypothetical protein
VFNKPNSLCADAAQTRGRSNKRSSRLVATL